MWPEGDPSQAAEWLLRARSNLAIAKAGRTSPDVVYADLCFEVQQAAEKAFKAVLVERGVPFRRTHVVAELFPLLTDAGVDLPERVRAAAALTRYATTSRYPGLSKEDAPTDEDYQRAVDIAETVVAWAQALLGSPPKERMP